VKAGVVVALLFALFACSGASSATVALPAFQHVVVIVFENKESPSVLGNRAAPTFNAYARRYAKLTRYYGITHPSLPNYLALVSGSTQGITNDCTDCAVDATSLADTVEASGRTWKTYLEGLPAPGFLGAASGRYAKKHNPFAYFRDIAADPARRARLVPLTQLAADVRTNALPNLSLVVPDLCHSMHDCSVSTGDTWLRGQVARFLQLPKTVVFVLFDEGKSNVGGGGHTTALALGKAVRPGSRFAGVSNHYGLLRTIEQAWGLPLLGHSAHVAPITGIWR
jgi:phosphatidylinositol-3-phosphatase